MRTFFVTTAVLFGALLAAAAANAQTVTLAPASGTPTQAVTITASGFGDSEPVDIYVDTVDTLLLVSSSTGTLSASAAVPATAQPGTHYITAIGRRSGDAAQKTFTVTTPWTQFGYSVPRLGLNPYENTLNTGNISSVGVRWSIAGGTGATPAIASGRVVVPGSTGIKALSTATGAAIWNVLPDEVFWASPAVATSLNRAYAAGATSGTLYCLNFATGATLWSKSLGSYFYSSPLVSGGVVYAATYDGTVYALNATTGATLWSFTISNTIYSSSPALANGILYFGAYDHKVYALNASTGTLIWSYTTGNVIDSSPAVSNGVVYIGSEDAKVYALRASTGALIWSYTTGGAVVAPPAVAYGSVFAGSTDGKLYSLSAKSGALQWSYPLGNGVKEPSVANGIVYAVSSDGSINAIAASYGGLLASGYSGTSLFGGPAISDGVIYVNGYSDSTTAFGLLAGNNVAAAPAHAPAISSLHPDLTLRVTR